MISVYYCKFNYMYGMLLKKNNIFWWSHLKTTHNESYIDMNKNRIKLFEIAE